LDEAYSLRATVAQTMTKHLKTTVICLSVAIFLFSGSLLAAPQKSSPRSSTSAAPIPAQIVSAQRIFIANAGGDESNFEAVTYTGGPHRAYNEFYWALKSWGRYALVNSPADADLVLEIRHTVTQIRRVEVLGDDKPASDSQLSLIIRDPKSQQILWALTEHIQSAVLQDNRDKNFEKALATLVTEVEHIAGPATSAKNQPASTPGIR
jgi:hypothetical protein